jgi:beta-mannosidase
VLGHDRAPKAGYDALREACRPVIVVADRLPQELTAGQALALDIHVVSDRREPLADAEVAARLHWSGGSRTWRWQGDIPADACQRVGTVQIVVPDAPGAATLELDCRYEGTQVSNRYEATIT